MVQIGSNTYREILSQPEVWSKTLASFHQQESDLKRFWELERSDLVIFTGCGSTYYLSLTAAAIFQHLVGITTQARPASELLYFPELVFPPNRRILLVAISRSGETTETLKAVSFFQHHKLGGVLSITCNHQSYLARHTDLCICADAAQEVSIAQTRSFSSMALLAQAFAGLAAGLPSYDLLRPVPDLCQNLLADYHALAREMGSSSIFQRFFFLGAGYLYGIAAEAMLKMKEMSLSYSEAYHPLEFRHGPMSMVDPSSLIIGLISSHALNAEVSVLHHLGKLNGNILSLCEQTNQKIETLGHVIELKSQLPDWAQPVLYLPVLQLIAYYRAIANQQNPDQPHNLTAVVRLEE